jgi:xanthine dehydrogenase accessory factor
MSRLRALAATWLVSGRRAVLVEVSEALGSAPREAGTRMIVSRDRTAGTVGGGHLELKAIEQARAMLAANAVEAAGATPVEAHYPLGPALGQCCGGAVTLRFGRLDSAALDTWPIDPPRFHLQLYGAGHVGRAIANALAPHHVIVDWIDERDDEFPADFYEAAPEAPWPDHIRKVCVDSVESEVRDAPANAFYLVLTHRHDLDLRISEAILERGDFAYFGLIGSKTKRQKFIHRFEHRGIDAGAIARMTCPIGMPGVEGKEPEVIAASVVAQLLMVAGALPAAVPATAARSARRASTATP